MLDTHSTAGYLQEHEQPHVQGYIISDNFDVPIAESTQNGVLRLRRNEVCHDSVEADPTSSSKSETMTMDMSPSSLQMNISTPE